MGLRSKVLLSAMAVAAVASGQSAYLRTADSMRLPSTIVDGNSPAVWQYGRLRVYTSTGDPIGMIGRDLFHLRLTDPPVVTPADHYPLWIEAVWPDQDGTVYAWYHHEHSGACAYKGLVTPEIGALVSYDGGRAFLDLGIVLSSGDTPNCDAKNGIFAGGHGDFSVILDQNHEYFYFLFTNYGGAASTQGVAMARMAFGSRASPVGAVYKYYLGGWGEPGVGGRVTPVFPAAVSWDRADTNSYWGPAVHWNTYLQSYVVLLNHACCQTVWPQEAIYLAFNPELSEPMNWTEPAKILAMSKIGFAPGYYPQVFGTGPGETDTLAGEVARFFVEGVSKWEIVFSRNPPPALSQASDGEMSGGSNSLSPFLLSY
jgi:hypothetical protein